MSSPRKVVTAAEMDAMTPQQRADLIDASVVRSWDEVDPEFREQALQAARVLNAQHRNDA
ncbi:MAG: hypothetical protein HY828_21450 [Actinobacteria bacterium]|jgi:hypothetical protein|nr:hypothetical protein [Actinomycetota bacterium]